MSYTRRHSKISYSNAVLAPLPAFTLALHCSSEFCTQRAAARTVLFRLKPRDRVTPALQELHWLPVELTVMRPRSSNRGRNTSASVTVKVVANAWFLLTVLVDHTTLTQTL